MPSPRIVHPYKFNPVAPNGYPMCNNGFGYPIIDYVGSDPNTRRSYNQDIGNSASGIPSGLTTYPGLGGGRYKQPFLHNMPPAYRIEVSDDNYHLKSRPHNMWWLSGTHIVQRTNSFFFSKIGGGRGDFPAYGGKLIVYRGICAKYKYNARVLNSEIPEIVPPEIPVFTNPGLNTTGEITWFDDIPYAPNPEEPPDEYWMIPFYLGINDGSVLEDISEVGTNFRGEWQLWTGYNNYTYILGSIGDPTFHYQYITYSTGFYPEGDGVNPNQGGSPLAFRPYEENIFHRPRVSVGDPGDNLWWPSTIRVYPYHG